MIRLIVGLELEVILEPIKLYNTFMETKNYVNNDKAM